MTGWSLTPDFPQLQLGSLQVSFQRYVRPKSGRATEPPPHSLGGLPVASVGDRFLLPVDAGEAFWIGLWCTGSETFTLEVIPVTSAGPLDGEYIAVPPVRTVAGWQGEDKRRLAFARHGGEAAIGLVGLIFEVSDGTRDGTMARASLELVDYATYANLTGHSAPDKLDPGAGYRGYRLP